ncbi:MAG: cell division inhibitor MinD [Candidatus Diapherotrites archaeon ADurb.Bin253]|jgi:septum site-determining protein MinD|nr:cell division ATPase MinD [Candidatus Pacearchaeota archaeon]OQA68745.1 MAG: cell division inhibitor MinD [Candidatus Diapherotrites archaeon ADurb.Bin253]HNZ52204.1 cell division ATPase MinD [Candidatus Pacearchaeota archaeon]HOC97213.1 cell division ATPase MinD [Candidatus Pacearchaeota archaeon]HOF43977.1 cell division ATPase MinD [Candidatus Pacearchaeota archaeon]
MNKIIVVTSGKGGVGKTTTAINLGAAINYFGKDVLIIDGNLSTPNVGLHLNSPEVPINLNHVLRGKAEPKEAIYEHVSGLKVMPSSLSIKELKKIKPEKISDFKKEFQTLSEYIIVDSSAGLGDESIAAINLADEIIVITNAEMPAITDALKTIKLAEQMKKTILGVIVTRVRKDSIEMSPESVKDMLEAPILGMIPEDITVKKALNKKDAVVHTHPHSNASRAYKEIAARITSTEYNSKKDRYPFWRRILKRENPYFWKMTMKKG